MSIFCYTTDPNLDSLKKLKEIAPGVWLYKEFLSTEQEHNMLKQLEETTESEWDNTHFNIEPGDQFHDFWFSRVSKVIWPFEYFHSIIISLFAPTYWISGAFRFFCRLRPSDSKPTVEEIENRNSNNNHYNFFSKWRLGVYIGEFTGGEVVFPDFNNFTVAVTGRDLLVWKSNYQFIINEVTSGVRYSYSDFLIDPFDHFFA
jgi:hypothetical protein